jgi:hypothetical protein
MINKQQMFIEMLQVAYSNNSYLKLTYFSTKEFRIKTHKFHGKRWRISSKGSSCIVLKNKETKKEHFLHTKNILGLEIYRKNYDFIKLIRSWLLQLEESFECLCFYNEGLSLGHLTPEYFTRVLNDNLEVLFDGEIFNIPLNKVDKIKYVRVM